MKVAVFYNISFSGAKRVVKEHVKGLRTLGHLVDVYTTDEAIDAFDPGIEANNKYYYSTINKKIIKVKMLNRLIQDYFYTFYKLRNIHKIIAKDIDTKNYDIVLVHTDISTQSPFLLRYLRTKSVYFCLEPLRNAYEYSLRLKQDVSIFNIMYENLNRWIRKSIDRKNTLFAKYILALSLFGRERIIAAYDLYPKISYLGVDEKIFKPKKIKKKNQIFFVAEKEYIYGYDLAEKAMNLIPINIRPTLKIVSWKKNNSERLTDEELVNIYNESLVTLSLSRFDTFGLVPLESMACGVPVIALNVAGYRETIKDNVTGFLTDFDPQEVADKIIYIINNLDKGKQMGDSGRKWIEAKWTWDKQVQHLEQILKEYINKK